MKFTLIATDLQKSGEFFISQINKTKETSRFIMLTSLPSIYFLAKRSGIKCFLVSRKITFSLELKDSDLEYVREYRSKVVKKRSVLSLIRRWYSKIEEINQDFPIKDIYVWNGQDVVGASIYKFKERNPEVETFFCEISNLPGKLYVDKEGTGIKSSFFTKNPLGHLEEVSDEAFRAWVEHYKEDKFHKNKNKIQQAENQKTFEFRHIYNTLYVLYLGYLFSFSYLLRKLKFKLLKGDIQQVLAGEQAIPGEFVLAPLQVSSDTNLIINSNANNYDLIDHCLLNYQLPVVVKLHPAEDDFSSLKKLINRFNQNERVFFSNKNIFDLLIRAEHIVTINSTVGLEAKIFGKDLSVLGFAPFCRLTNYSDLKKYIMGFLLDIDYFKSDNNVSLFNTIEASN